MNDEQFFESLYKNYIIKERNSSCFIGMNSKQEQLRDLAIRFTKDEALEFIQDKDNLIIETIGRKFRE